MLVGHCWARSRLLKADGSAPNPGPRPAFPVLAEPDQTVVRQRRHFQPYPPLAPEDVAPDDVAWVGGEQEAEEDNHPDAQVGDKPPVLPRHAGVMDDEYFKDENEAQSEDEPTVAPFH